MTTAALKILRGEMTERGVTTAEQAPDPESFVTAIARLPPELQPHGQLVRESLHWLDGEVECPQCVPIGDAHVAPTLGSNDSSGYGASSGGQVLGDARVAVDVAEAIVTAG